MSYYASPAASGGVPNLTQMLQAMQIGPSFDEMYAFAQTVDQESPEGTKEQLYAYLDALQQADPQHYQFIPTLSRVVKALVDCTNHDTEDTETPERIRAIYTANVQMISTLALEASVIELHISFIHSLNSLGYYADAFRLSNLFLTSITWEPLLSPEEFNRFASKLSIQRETAENLQYCV